MKLKLPRLPSGKAGIALGVVLFALAAGAAWKLAVSFDKRLAYQAPLPVEVDVVLERRLPEPVEAAAYFVVAEGLANVVKYASASAVSVTVGRANGSTVIDVADDGIGGADPSHGSGLRGLADRVEALGGALAVVSPPGRGTQLHVEIPCES